MAAFKNKSWLVSCHSAAKSDFNIKFVEVDFFVVQEHSKSKKVLLHGMQLESSIRTMVLEAVQSEQFLI